MTTPDATFWSTATLDRIAAMLRGKRLQVREALLRAGPCTTRELAARMGWDILNVRPRVTELLQLGFIVEVTEGEPHRDAAGKITAEGVYRALCAADAIAKQQAMIREARGDFTQTELTLAAQAKR